MLGKLSTASGDGCSSTAHSSNCNTNCLIFLTASLNFVQFCCCCSVAMLRQTLHNPMDTRLPSLPLSPKVFPSSCLLPRWCHPTISSSVELFSFCLQSFPASGSFPMSQLFISDSQSIGVSASASVLPMSIQGWFPLGVTGLIYVSICVKDTISSGTFQNSIPSLVQLCQLDFFFFNRIQEY